MTMTSNEVPLREVFHLFQCSVCRSVPMFPPVHSCRLGHNVCSSCVDLINHHCNECHEPLSGRNLNLEEVLVQTMFGGPKDLVCSDDIVVRRAAAEARMDLVVANECLAQMLVSGRTVKCPFPCGARVTASGLYRHFGFEHPEVLVGMLVKNRPFPVVVPGDLLGQSTSLARCIYILVVDIGDDGSNDYDRLTALDSMNAAELLSITDSMRYMLQRHTYLAMLSIKTLNKLQGLAVWITALYDFSPVKYTLRYNNGPNCTTYQGRPRSLLTSDNAVYDCLILPSVPILTSQDLKLTLIFHLDLPFPRGHPSVDQPDVGEGLSVL